MRRRRFRGGGFGGGWGRPTWNRDHDDFNRRHRRPRGNGPSAGIGGTLIGIGIISLIVALESWFDYQDYQRWSGRDMRVIPPLFGMNIITALAVIGVVLGLAGIIMILFISPAWKKPPDSTNNHDGFQGSPFCDHLDNPHNFYGERVIKCEKCDSPLTYEVISQSYSCQSCKKRCKHCNTELIFKEHTQTHDCPYCHISFTDSEIT